MSRSLFLLFLFFSCATRPPFPRLFPFGVYQHQVTVESNGKTQTFFGVNKWSPQELTMVALGALDVTLVKYTENLKSGEKEVFIDKNFIPLTEQEAKEYLGHAKKIYSLDQSICEKKWCHKKIFGLVDLHFDLNDAHEVSEMRFEVRDSKVRIKVVGYEKSL